MRTKNKLGICLSSLGAAALILRNMAFIRRNKPVEIGRVQMTKGEKTLIPLQPVIGIISLVCGVLLLGMFNFRNEEK